MFASKTPSIAILALFRPARFAIGAIRTIGKIEPIDLISNMTPVISAVSGSHAIKVTETTEHSSRAGKLFEFCRISNGETTCDGYLPC